MSFKEKQQAMLKKIAKKNPAILQPALNVNLEFSSGNGNKITGKYSVSRD